MGLKDIIDGIKIISNLRLSGALDWLTSKSPKGLRIAAVALLLVCVGATAAWWTSMADLQHELFQALGSRTEGTPQPQKGLEAFIVSSVSDSIERSLASQSVRAEYFDAVNSLAKHLQDSTKAFKAIKFLSDDKNRDYKNKLTVVTKNGDRLSEKYLTDDGGGFLFLPATIVRLGTEEATPPQNQPAKGESPVPSDSALKLAMTQSPQLLRDVVVSGQYGADICGLNGEDVLAGPAGIVDPRPIQSYYITSSGVMRICQGNVTDQRKWYQKQFSPTRFFPDRPYFRATFERGQGAAASTIDKDFHRTPPYLDLGGNGVVITLCKPVINDSSEQSIVCIDLKLKGTAVDEIKTTIVSLGGWAEWINCKPDASRIYCDENRLPETIRDAIQATGNKYLETGKENLSDFFGQIQKLDPEQVTLPARTFWQKLRHGFQKRDERLMFAVPVAQTESGGGKLLYCEIDLVAAAFSQSLKAGVAIGSFLCLLSILMAIFGDYYLRLQQQEVAFERVDQVMEFSPVGYVRLNENDHLVAYNQRFVDLLGYKSRDEAKGFFASRPFADLVVGDMDKRRYKERTALRGTKDDKLEPYTVRIRAEHNEVTLDICGAGIPAPRIPARGQMQTFGILLEPKPNVVSITDRERGTARTGA